MHKYYLLKKIQLHINCVSIETQIENIYSIIPLNIFQTWHTLDLPLKMKENVELLKQQNPEFKHYLYDDKMCRDFIKNNFNEDILYTFDKLKPGAFKADLWRYCILYINGGIYLDIKYRCCNNFKLIELTDKEYYVKDRFCLGITGIYNALLICLPNNNIIYNCIQSVVKNVKNNNYNNSSLDITGPHTMSIFFNEIDMNNLNLHFDSNNILLNNNKILNVYDEYRNEQSKFEKTKYYTSMWLEKNIYNYPILESKNIYNYTKQIIKNIMGKEILFYSGTPTIIELLNNKYLINIRWINYSYNNDGSKKNIPQQWISLNSRFMVDLSFNKINEEIFLEEDFEKEKYFDEIGLEDIRIFNYLEKYYYIATYFDHKRQIISVSSNEYNICDLSYNLNKTIILPQMYNLSKIKQSEKNWSFVNYKNELCIIYKWFPLQIGKINYETNEMNIIEIKYNIPDYFNNARGNTCGYEYNNEIWFVLHKAQQYDNIKTKYNYQHFFAVFDLEMNIIRYSELFKFGDCTVEFCIGLIVKNDNIILSYSLLDTECIIAEYDINYINKKIKWYSNNIL
jgi:mannosyltransferase OCH1-like enzyme